MIVLMIMKPDSKAHFLLLSIVSPPQSRDVGKKGFDTTGGLLAGTDLKQPPPSGDQHGLKKNTHRPPQADLVARDKTKDRLAGKPAGIPS
jgi:hypothetical protein